MRSALAFGLAAALAAGLTTGCLVRIHPGHYSPPPPDHGVFTATCHHDATCGHYWYNGSWYAAPAHRHGAGCGHYFHGGRWVYSGEYTVERGHACNAGCNHYHHDGRWYVMHQHRHGPGCGHVLSGGIWLVLR